MRLGGPVCELARKGKIDVINENRNYEYDKIAAANPTSASARLTAITDPSLNDMAHFTDASTASVQGRCSVDMELLEFERRIE